MQQFTTKELYYIAGLLEGEGSFCAQTNNRGARYITIKVKMTDEDIVRWVADKWECSVIVEEFENHYKTAYITQLRRKEEAVEFLTMIKPLMGKRRQDRISEILCEFSDNNED